MLECSQSRSEPVGSDIDRLVSGGFVRAGTWHLLSGVFALNSTSPLPREPGVYAYAIDGKVHYVGAAQRGLHARLRHYEISKTLRTAKRVRQKIMEILAMGNREVEIFVLVPQPLYWRGLPIDLVAGVEEGLIRELRPIWNVRGMGAQR